MAAYRWHESTFITEVAGRRGYRLEGDAGSGWRMHGVGGPPPGIRWTVTLTPASGETGPRIVWRTTDVRADDDARHQLVVGRSTSGGTTFGTVEGGAVGALLTAGALAVGALLRRRRDRAVPPPQDSVLGPGRSVLGPGWSVLDPSGVLDTDLVPWFATWPTAWWGPDDERPARLDRVWLSTGGLELSATDWWCSAPALDQLVGLGVEIARRLERAIGRA